MSTKMMTKFTITGEAIFFGQLPIIAERIKAYILANQGTSVMVEWVEMEHSLPSGEANDAQAL